MVELCIYENLKVIFLFFKHKKEVVIKLTLLYLNYPKYFSTEKSVKSPFTPKSILISLIPSFENSS